MILNFNSEGLEKYKSLPQKIKFLSENWVAKEIFCPSCGNFLNKADNNLPVLDFVCQNCKEEYELKSSKKEFIKRITDGAYSSMIKRLESNNNPSFFLLNYDLKYYKVINFLVIPKHFFSSKLIERRNPLKQTARRAGWVGCNIDLSGIPQIGKIYYVKKGIIRPKEEVLEIWKKTFFLREEKNILSKGWLLDIMKCVEELSKKEFTLDEVYAFEKRLKLKYSQNAHIKDKIRQQLQILRDKGYLEFIGRGKYRLL
ncbi:MAG: DpnI domain-containing protein [Elusimicrobiota bacterium]